MDRTSILGDTIDYTRELLDKIHKLREEGMEERNDQIDLIEKTYSKDVKPNEMQIRNPPKVRTYMNIIIIPLWANHIFFFAILTEIIHQLK